MSRPSAAQRIASPRKGKSQLTCNPNRPNPEWPVYRIGELTFVMSATLIALAGHLMEIALWAFALDICGAVADISAAIYSSAGSYTTVGSDIVLPPRWKLLGPLEAVSGMLMFGLTTAFIFAVIQRLIHARFDDADNFPL